MSETGAKGPAAVSAAEGVAGRVIDGGHYIRAAEAGLTGMVTLRTDLAAAEVAAAVAEATGAEMPAALSTTAGEAGRAVWMSPDELLLIVDEAQAAEVVEKLSGSLGETRHMALDVSDARVMFRLEGARVPEVFAKGMPVDFRDAAFPVGTARRSHLGEVSVGVWRTDEAAWQLVCFRSVAHHVADWLAAASVSGSEVHPA